MPDPLPTTAMALRNVRITLAEALARLNQPEPNPEPGEAA